MKRSSSFSFTNVIKHDQQPPLLDRPLSDKQTYLRLGCSNYQNKQTFSYSRNSNLEFKLSPEEMEKSQTKTHFSVFKFSVVILSVSSYAHACMHLSAKFEPVGRSAGQNQAGKSEWRLNSSYPRLLFLLSLPLSVMTCIFI